MLYLTILSVASVQKLQRIYFSLCLLLFLVLVACNKEEFNAPVNSGTPNNHLIRIMDTNPQFNGGSKSIKSVDPVSFVLQKTHHFNLSGPTQTLVQPVDVVFVMDMSASMQPQMTALKNGVNTLVNQLHTKGLDVAIGIIGFIDSQNSINQRTFNLRVIRNDNKTIEQQNISAITSFINNIQTQGNHDYQEGGLLAINNGIQMLRTQGRAKAAKVIVYVTDEVAHNGGAEGTSPSDAVHNTRNCDLGITANNINTFANQLTSTRHFKFYYSVPNSTEVNNKRQPNSIPYKRCGFDYPTQQMQSLLSQILPNIPSNQKGGELVNAANQSVWPLNNSTTLVDTLTSQLDKDIIRDESQGMCIARSVNVIDNRNSQNLHSWSQSVASSIQSNQLANELQLNEVIKGNTLAPGNYPLTIRVDRCCVDTAQLNSPSPQCNQHSFTQNISYILEVR